MGAVTHEVGDWLDALGLGQYAQVFAENGIDFDVLPDLTDRDLEKLGVLLGHRRKMLRGIAGLAAAGRGAPKARNEPPVAEAVERRQLTVMFGDLVGSTALSAQLDPEDLRRVYRAYRDACVRVVARYGGHLAQFMGDGVMVYFGYPRAHEDDAERAVRAGLDVIAAVGWLRTPGGGRVEARIGIATGLVVAGDLSVQEQAVVGETPNLAARLQAMAAPGTVVVAVSTRRLLGELFRLRSLGGLTVKGVAEPVEAWLVEGEAPSESRFEMVRARRLTRFVGREREVALIEERQRLAWRGEGQIVQISGEAGIGKSRFAAQFTERLADQPHTQLGCQCSPYHTASAFYPIIEHLKRAASLDPGDPPQRQLDKVEAMIALATPRVSEVAPLLAALLSLPSGDRYPPLGLSAIERRQQTLMALVDQLEGLARQKPVLLLFEDVHWADASTLEVLDLMAERVRQLPVLALITYRPEFPPRWAGLDHVNTLTLGRLDRGEACAMIDQVSGGKQLPDEVTGQIVAKADGVPLFVEELTKTVLESGLLVEEAKRYRLDGPLPPLAIPATLQDALMARLDRLAPIKEIAAIGALIGREFSCELLHTVAGRDRAMLDDALAQLEAAELVFRSGDPPDLRYRFSHALVQDAAYESLLRSHRQVLHRRIAEILREGYPGVAEGQPEVIARHYTHAGLTEPAVDWWTKAGDQAAGRSAYVEATAHYGQAIALADTLPSDAPRRQRRFKLQVAYGQTLHGARGPGASETAAVFARARELAEEIEDPAERLPVYYGVWSSRFTHGDIVSTRALADTFLRDTERRPGSPEASIAYRVLGMTACMQGDLTSGGAHLERAVAAYDPSRDHALHFLYGHDVGVAAMSNLAVVLWQTGEVGRACKLAEEGLRTAADSRHIPTMVWGYHSNCVFEGQRRDVARAMSSATTLVDLTREHFPRSIWFAFATFMLGWSCWMAGNREAEMAAMLRQGVVVFQEQGLHLYLTFLRGLFAETQAAAGDAEAALATLGEAIADTERTGLAWFRSELHRQRGDILLSRLPADLGAAEEAFDRALGDARSQQARSFELRAALGLTRVYCATGRERAAECLLSPMVAAFNREPDFPEIAHAQRFLHTVRQAAGC